jgi:hypothetical protein
MKSHKLVRFPFTEFNPARFLASVPRTTIERHKSGFRDMPQGPPGHGGVFAGRSLSVNEPIPEDEVMTDVAGAAGDRELGEIRDGLMDIRRSLSVSFSWPVSDHFHLLGGSLLHPQTTDMNLRQPHCLASRAPTH